jgi:phage tail tape-measure protein
MAAFSSVPVHPSSASSDPVDGSLSSTPTGLHAIRGADPILTVAIADCWARNAANGLSGRQLPALFADAGLRDPKVIVETMTSTDPQQPSLPPFPQCPPPRTAPGSSAPPTPRGG